MDTQKKRNSLTKQLNQYTNTITIGQMTQLGAEEVKHNFLVYLGRPPVESEIKVYQNHPDDKVLVKNLKMIKDRLEPKMPSQGQQMQGQGGSNNNQFVQSLVRGASTAGQQLNAAMPQFRNVQGAVSPQPQVPMGARATSGQGFRTDRHNNPAAFTTDVAASAGLIPGVDYVQGDPFRGADNQTYYTAKLLGDPIATTAKVIDRIGFYTGAGKPRWSYTQSIPGIENWTSMDLSGKANIISQMYKHEGGSGSLINGGGQGGPSDLGNVTTNFGDQTRDTNFHTGVDIANQEGTPIPEFKGGQVTQVGSHPEYGNYVTVKDSQGNTERYSHLNRALVAQGQNIPPGQAVGLMGKTGNVYSNTGSDPSHLHLEVVDAYNKFINPMDYLK